MIFLTTFNEKSLVMCLKTVTFEVGTTGARAPWSSKGMNTKKRSNQSVTPSRQTTKNQ